MNTFTNTKKPVTAVVSTDALKKLDDAVAKANERNNGKFLNRSQIIDAVLFNEKFKKYPPEELSHIKTDDSKTVCFSISEDGLTKLKEHKKEHNVTPSVMLDNIVRRELIAVEKVMGCCEHVIVGKSGNKNYFVSLNKLNALSGLSKKIKKAIGQYSEVVDYQDEYFVIVPYSVLFRYFSEGEMNACS